jgi:hypothetical protein
MLSHSFFFLLLHTIPFNELLDVAGLPWMSTSIMSAPLLLQAVLQ